MRKLLFVLLAVLLLTGVAFAGDAPSLPNAEIISGYGGATGVSPYTKIIKVRYTLQEANAASLSSGDVVVWDTNSADGVSISACVADGGSSMFAGVLVGTIQTADSLAAAKGTDRNWGYIAVKGHCLAKVDTSNAATGEALVLNGGTLTGSLGTTSSLSHITISQDIGVLLRDSGADTLMPVFLK